MSSQPIFLLRCISCYAFVSPFCVVTITQGEQQSFVRANEDAAHPGPPVKSPEAVGEYVVEIYEDRNGHIWFGTMAKGVARFDGKALSYFDSSDGLPSDTISSIVEDRDGHLWFGTHGGVAKYDGKAFRNFTTADGLADDRVTRILPDGSGNLWISTFNGVTMYDGTNFRAFPLPIPKSKGPRTVGPFQIPGRQWVRDILIDRRGHIWFSRDGYGVCRYDGKRFTHFLMDDGLASNSVFSMTEDGRGNVWFACVQHQGWFTSGATRKNPGDDGGACFFDGKKISNVGGIDYEKGNNVFTVYTDRTGSVWISNIGRGMFRYDGKTLLNFNKTDQPGEEMVPVQSVLEDRHGRLWFGCSGGLYRLIDDKFVAINVDGPWPSRD
ncbi:MAG: ligand-binding sensor domain-containing protein [Phycisphaerae bacterium]